MTLMIFLLQTSRQKTKMAKLKSQYIIFENNYFQIIKFQSYILDHIETCQNTKYVVLLQKQTTNTGKT